MYHTDERGILVATVLLKSIAHHLPAAAPPSAAKNIIIDIQVALRLLHPAESPG